jgi:ATP-binding cassette subfamily B protein
MHLSMSVSATESPGGAHPALRDLALLQFMPDEVRELVAGSFEPVSFPFGAVIVREGDEADAFYLLVSGSARAVKAGEGGEEVPLNVLGPGDAFGEVALLEGGTRTATVRASSEVEALRLDRGVFQALLRANPEIHEYVELSTRTHQLRDFFRLYSAFARLRGDLLAVLLRELRPLSVAQGQQVVKEGEAPGPMYIVRDGRLRAFKRKGGGTEDVAYLRKGDFFGERSLLKDDIRAATVEALTDCELLELRPETFHRLMAEKSQFRELIEERAAQYEYKQLANVPLDFAEELLPAEAAVREGERVIKPAEGEEDLLEEQVSYDWGDGFRKPDKRIRRFQHLWQVDEMDCGAACVGMIARHFGRAVSLAHIRRVVFTTTDGTSLAGIAQGAEQLGLASRAVKASKSRLDELPVPAVVHWGGNHWIVLYDVQDGRVRVADPAIGLRRLKREEFEDKWTGYAVLFRHTPEFEQAPVAESTIRWILDFFRPYRRRLLQAFGLALLAAALQMLIPVFSQVIVDSVVADRDYGLLTLLVFAMLGVLVLSVGLTVLQRYLLSWSAVRIDGSALDFLTGRMLQLPVGYFLTRKTGDIERRLAGLRQVRTFAVEQGVLGLTAAMQLIVAVVLMFVYSWQLALIYLASVPLYAGLMRFSRKRLRPIFDSLEESFGEYQSRQIDAIKGIETVKAMGAEGSLRKLLLRQWDELAHRLFRADLTMMLYEAAIQAVTFLSFAIFLWFGALQVLDGNLSVGELVAFNALVLLANGPIATVLWMWDQLQYSSVLLNRLNDIVDQEPEQGADHSHLQAVRSLSGRVELRGVGFDYGGPVPIPVLEELTLDVEPGTMVAIIGRSGSGKTTLAKCLAGLLEPTSGVILYDGVDLKTLDYRKLRRHIGFVLQDNHLFDVTITGNIAFGEEEPDMERVEWAAGLANAHEFVHRLPLGYETRVGETGLRLSAGQRQRIAIARAVYSRPPVLILDEATSSLDTESERAVKENLDALLEGRTSFVIAHRLSTVRDADLIVVLEKGRIVERGNHDELMNRQGIYFYLTSQQLGA